jgi:integrase
MAVALDFERMARGLVAASPTAAAVNRLAADLLSRLGEQLHNPTVENFFTDWLKGKAGPRGDSKRGVRYEVAVRLFLDSLGKRAGQPISSIVAADVMRFRDAEVMRGKSATTANLSHKVVASCFEAARRQGLIEQNPARAFEYLETHSEGVEKQVFAPEEVSRLLRAAPSDAWRGVILLGYFAGLRLGDALRLTWGNVDLQGKVISFTPSKTSRLGKKLVIPMHSEIEAFLLELPAGDRASDFLFPKLAGLGIGGKSGASMCFRRIMDRAGVPAGLGRAAAGKAGRSVSLRSFHSLRHSHITALAGAGVGIEIRQKLVGHASEKQNLHYSHPDFERLRAAVDCLPGLDVSAFPAESKETRKKKPVKGGRR